MIKINDINKVNDLKTAKTPKASGGESFSVYLKETMKPQAAPVGPGGAISVADAIFAAQMVDADEEKEVRKNLSNGDRPCWKSWRKSVTAVDGIYFARPAD